MNKYNKNIKIYMKEHNYSNLIITSYISKSKRDNYLIELKYEKKNNIKIINIYETPILLLAIEIFNHINNENMHFLIDSKERKKWIESYLKDVELNFYNSLPKKEIKTYDHLGYDEIKLIITQNNCSYLVNSHSVIIESIIKKDNGEYYLKTIVAYESDNFINALKAFDYIKSSCEYIYNLYLASIKINDLYYLNVCEWIMTNKHLNKLKNKFEVKFRLESLFSDIFPKEKKEFIDSFDCKQKKYYSNKINT